MRGVFEGRPGTRAADQARWALEHALIRLVTRGGLAAVASALRLAHGGFEPGPTSRWGRTWRAPHRSRKHTVMIAVSDDGVCRTTSVVYAAADVTADRMAGLTPAQRATHARQEAFYARYMAVGRAAYGRPGGHRTLGRADRLLLHVGELEADVNNGGFGQYLSNKGPRRARATLRALRAIGAAHTAGLLERALAAKSEAALSRLDDRFCRATEDLAVLALDFVEKRRGRPW